MEKDIRDNRHSAEEILTVHGVRLTAMRLFVYRTMETFENTFSLADLEEKLDTVDKSTIFRIIRTFDEHHLLHDIEDGSGSKKYCLCHSSHHDSIEELHCHFYCNRCQRTFCLNDAHIPLVSIPEGFVTETAEYVIKGLCPECSRRQE